MPIGYENGGGGGSHEPRRTKSLPTKYMIPSEDMGEYESSNSRRRSAPAKPAAPPSAANGGGLFPLDEEGTYGAAPRRPGMPPTGPSQVPFSRIRERKPKAYSSYGLDSNCQMHAKKLAKAERNAEQAIRKHSSGSNSGSRPVSRSGSMSRASPSPVRRYSSYGGGGNGGGSVGNGGTSSRASSTGRSSRSPEPYNGSSRKSSAEKTYSSYGGGSSHHSAARRSNSTSSFRNGGPVREIPISIEERDEYSYAENNGFTSSTSGGGSTSLRRSSSTRNSYTSSSSSTTRAGNLANSIAANGSYRKTSDETNRMVNGKVSLDGMRKPKIDSWDSMGILGLTTKIWNDTRKRQETFMESTGHFLREESSSYIM